LDELLASQCGESEEGVLDVAMAPVGALDFGDAADIACSEGV
jgi:hypothetical protein